MDDKRYWAFLSYSHDDRVWARWLHRALEAYVVPRRLAGRPTRFGQAPRRLRPVFRDREELTADASLRARVNEALEASNYLIVLCSPTAAASPWVEEEVVRFKARHGEDRVLAVIVGGAPRASFEPGREAEECFPAALRVRVDGSGQLTDERADPIAADLRPGGDGRRLALLKLLSRMLEVGLDDLVRRDAQRRQRELAGVATVSVSVAIVMAALAVAALAARDEARAQRAQAEGLVEFMLGDLRKRLEPEGRLDALDAVGARALVYYGAQAAHGMDADALGRRARVLHMLGEIDLKRGDQANALKLFQQAAATTAELLAREPHNQKRIFEHAQSVFWVGDVARRRGESATAEAEYAEYKRLATALVAEDPNNDDWLAELGYANVDLGTLWLKQGRAEPAAAAFREGLRIYQVLAAKAPGDWDRQMGLAGTWAWLADAERGQGRLGAAMSDRLAEKAIYDRLVAGGRGNSETAYSSFENEVAVGRLDMVAGAAPAAVAQLEAATRDADRLIEANPDNTEYRAKAVEGWVALTQAQLRVHDLDAASSAADRALALAGTLVRRDPTVSDWRGPLLGGARLGRIRIDAERATSLDERRDALAPALSEARRLEKLADNERIDLPLAGVVAAAELLAGDHERLAGRPDEAQRRWTSAVVVLTRAGPGATWLAGDSAALILATARQRLAGDRPEAAKPGRRLSVAFSPRIAQGYAW